eukprot:gene18508-11357_t
MGKTAEADVPGGGGDNYLNVDSTDRAVSVANPAYEATATFGEEKPQPPPSSPRWKSIAIVLGVVALAFVVLFALAIAGAIGHGASSSTVAASGGDATDGESPTLASFATGEGEAAVEHVCSCDCERFDELDAWNTSGFYPMLINGVELEGWCDQENDGGGWTAVIDPSNDVAPEITHVHGREQSGYRSADAANFNCCNGAGRIYGKKTFAVNGEQGTSSCSKFVSGCKGYSKGSFVASHPSFTEIRVIYGSGDICQNTGTTSMTKFQWGTECGVDGNGADDWLARWFMAPDALTCTASFYGDSILRGQVNYRPGQSIVSQSCTAATDITIEFGDEIGARQGGHGSNYMQWESIYVR